MFFTSVSRVFLFFFIHFLGKRCVNGFIFVSKGVYRFLFELCLGNRSTFSLDLMCIFDSRGSKNCFVCIPGHTNGCGSGQTYGQTTIMPKCFGKYMLRVKKRRRSEAYFLPATRLSLISRLQTSGLIASPYLPDAS